VNGEDAAIAAVLNSGSIVGGGDVTQRAQEFLGKLTGARKVLLTGSGTSALEFACLLLNLKAGDEVIVPSFTFSSCANSIALRGAVPVFVDIRPDTLNIDETIVEDAITSRTRAIMPVHYAGVAADMEVLSGIAARHGLAIIEDAAQGVGATYRGAPLGSLGTLAALSFHGSKNVSCGEGGALLVNDASFEERAEILWEKGTNRSRFIRGEVDKYTWMDIGSSFLPSEVTAALLLAQLEAVDVITIRRREAWHRYHAALAGLEQAGWVRRPVVPQECDGNAHIYAVLLPTAELRDPVLSALKARGIQATFHYIPLHSAPAGRRLGRVHGSTAVTDELSARLLRLPLFHNIEADDQAYVVDCLEDIVKGLGSMCSK
jgi:dTDP-4-amino-4,6-dideoxygalactose transaminase